MPSYKLVVFTSKSRHDNNLVSVNLRQLFARPDQVLSQDDVLVLELKRGRQVCPTHFRVNRANASTASTKSWPGVLPLPTPANSGPPGPVTVECRVLSIAPPTQAQLQIPEDLRLGLGC